MDKLLNIVVNLSSTPVQGRYTLKINELNIIKDNPKTIIVAMKYGESRQQKSDLLKVKSDFKNDQLNRLQFYVMCYVSQKDEAIKLLTTALKSHIDYLSLQNKHAISAYEAGYKIVK